MRCAEDGQGLTIGTDKLGGRGVYAARDFTAGEGVVAYELRLLTRFDRCCDVAWRNIGAGEAITIDAKQETDRELTTFIAA